MINLTFLQRILRAYPRVSVRPHAWHGAPQTADPLVERSYSVVMFGRKMRFHIMIPWNYTYVSIYILYITIYTQTMLYNMLKWHLWFQILLNHG